MKAYVTKKENLRLPASPRKKQRNKSFSGGGESKKNRKTSESAALFLLKEFSGEMVSPVNMILFPAEEF